MPPLELATRKKGLVQELNGYITAKKDFTVASSLKAELTGANTPRGAKSPMAKSQEGMKISNLVVSTPHSGLVSGRSGGFKCVWAGQTSMASYIAAPIQSYVTHAQH